jgi:hypothetical protein
MTETTCRECDGLILATKPDLCPHCGCDGPMAVAVVQPDGRVSEPITSRRLAACLARAIFEMGDEPNSRCTRIQFKGGRWPNNERNQGGIAEEPLAIAIKKKLIEWGCPTEPTPPQPMTHNEGK